MRKSWKIQERKKWENWIKFSKRKEKKRKRKNNHCQCQSVAMYKFSCALTSLSLFATASHSHSKCRFAFPSSFEKQEREKNYEKMHKSRRKKAIVKSSKRNEPGTLFSSKGLGHSETVRPFESIAMLCCQPTIGIFPSSRTLSRLSDRNAGIWQRSKWDFNGKTQLPARQLQARDNCRWFVWEDYLSNSFRISSLSI